VIQVGFDTHAFVVSPDIVTAMAFAGNLSFNTLVDTLQGSDGKPFRLSSPPAMNYHPVDDPGQDTFQLPPQDRVSVAVAVDPKIDQLQLLQLFKLWNGKTPTDLPILIKVKGKCSAFLYN
jgi:aconitate hydratase